MLQTEFEFELPKGYIDPDGAVHRKGVMRLAQAIDEIAPLQDLRVSKNPAYLVVILLSRVVVKLGTCAPITPKVIEGLFTEDLAYLHDKYRDINGNLGNRVTACPKCGHHVEVASHPAGKA